MRVSAHRHSFSHKLRLKTSKDFQQASRPQKISGRHFILLVRPNSYDYPRLGISISKRKVRKAVSRNRIKRIIRESFRYQQTELKGLDIIVIPHKDVDQVDNERLRESLEKQWQQLTNFYHKA